jgi:hypothetical protein
MVLALLVLVASVLEKRPADLKCSISEFRGPVRHWDLVARTARLVDSATVIVRARPIAFVAAAPPDPARPSPHYASQLVTFEVLERLRGPDSLTSLVVEGELVSQDDFNPGTVPYAEIRSAGQRGNCFALEYRYGAEYLLLLRIEDGRLTPYWWPLAPLNEQVRGPGDPWIVWVRNRIMDAR